MNRCIFITALLMGAGLLAGCGAATQVPVSIDELRRHAQDRPTDAHAQARLGIGEYVANHGDPTEARELLATSLQADGSQPGARLMLALIDHFQGRPGDALGGLLRVLNDCAAAPHPDCAGTTEVAGAAISELANVAPDFSGQVTATLPDLLGEGGANLGPATRFQIGRVLMDATLRAGNRAASEELEEALGCVTTWRVTGPFGPWDLLGFDDQLAPERDAILSSSYELGPNSGVRATRESVATTCAVHLGNPAIQSGGTSIAESFIDIDIAGEYDVRIDSPNSVKLDLGEGVSIRMDRRRSVHARVSFHRVYLPAGRHRVRVKMTTRHPNPVFSLAVAPAQGPAESDPPAATNHLRRYLRAAVAMARGHAVQSRETLRLALSTPAPSALLLTVGALAAMSDRLRPNDIRRDQARGFLQIARDREPAAWYPAVQLARLRAAEGQELQAIAELRPVMDRWPDLAIPRQTLAELLAQRGFMAEAHARISEALTLSPENCDALRVALNIAHNLQRSGDITSLSERLTSCDARQSARFRRLLQQRAWTEAGREIERLQALSGPTGASRFIPGALEVAAGQMDRATQLRLLQELTEDQPRSALHAETRVDALLASGHRDAAHQFMTEALEREPAQLPELRRIQRTTGGEDLFAQWRLDGSEIIAEFEASGRQYDQPDAMILDYTVIRVFDDGSTAELTHNIHRLQSEEAVDAHGEFNRPENARVLRLRTIKADGRILEPDEIAGKDTISLPSLAPGDYVETEYVRYAPPLRAGGSRGWRFYFQSPETPFDRTELIVLTPPHLPVTIEPRGDPPETERRTEGGLSLYRWVRRESRPRPQEPRSVSGVEFMPSIHWGIHAGWEPFVNSLVDQLADRDVADPSAVRVLGEILGVDRNADDLTRARLIYAWVLANVETSNRVFGQAASMLAQREGTRGRIIHYLFGLAGIESRLLMASQITGDRIPSRISTDSYYQHLVVELRLGEATAPIYLFGNQRGAPFGYLPPGLLGQEARYLERGGAPILLPETTRVTDAHHADAHIRLQEDGSAEITVSERFRGTGAVRWRSDLEQVPDAVLEQRFEEFYVAQLLPGGSLTELAIEGREDPEADFVLSYQFRVPAIGRRSEQAWSIPTLFPHHFSVSYAQLDARTTTELVFPLPNDTIRVRITVPEGMSFTEEAAAAQEGVSDTRLGASVSATRTLDGRTLTVDRVVRLTRPHIEPSEYADFAHFCREADELEGREVTVRTQP